MCLMQLQAEPAQCTVQNIMLQVQHLSALLWQHTCLTWLSLLPLLLQGNLLVGHNPSLACLIMCKASAVVLHRAFLLLLNMATQLWFFAPASYQFCSNPYRYHIVQVVLGKHSQPWWKGSGVLVTMY